MVVVFAGVKHVERDRIWLDWLAEGNPIAPAGVPSGDSPSLHLVGGHCVRYEPSPRRGHGEGFRPAPHLSSQMAV